MKRWNILVVMMCLFLIHDNALAYDDKTTHPLITESAIGKSVLDVYLKSYLDLPEGAGTKYNGSSIITLIQVGSTNEDTPIL